MKTNDGVELQNQGEGTHAGYSMLHTAASRGDKAAGPRQ